MYIFICVYFAQKCSVPPSGELKTSQPLDREEQDKHTFKVRAVDGGGRYCEADVHITVEDVNDNPPQFSSDPYTITVFENTETGTYVAKLLANDIDTGEFILRHNIGPLPEKSNVQQGKWIHYLL